MKRLLFSLIMVGLGCGLARAGHRRYFRSADDINTGTLDPSRVSPSTFTLRGSQWSLDIDASTTALAAPATLSASSTMTYCLCSAGDTFLSTTPLTNGSDFMTMSGTFNITNAWGYQSLSSTPGYNTCSSTYAIAVSTDRAGNAIIWRGIDDSSYTVVWSSSIDTNGHKPAKSGNASAARVLAWNHIYMFQMTDASTCAGIAPSGVWGVYFKGWWEP